MTEHGLDPLASPTSGTRPEPGGGADEALAIRLARAVVGRHACERAGLTPVDETDLQTAGPRPYLTLSPYWPLGYPMIVEMLVLERLENPEWSDRSGETPRDGNTGAPASPGDSGVTWADRALSDAAAFFFDELVNPVLPYGARAPAAAQTPPLNRPYQRAVTEAVFAQHPQDSAAHARRAAARDLLYDTDETGQTVPSQVQLDYWEYVEREKSARAALETLAPDVSEADRAAAQTALDRVRADWRVLGRRAELEAALKLLAAPDLESRNKRLLDRLHASLQLRLDRPGVSYAVSRLVPVTPLLTGGGGSQPGGQGWERVELDHETVRGAVLELARSALVPSVNALEPEFADLEELSFEFLACDVHREWLAEELFTAHDWDLPGGRRLADGLGDGPLGGYASTVLFVRGVSLRYTGPLTARFGPQGDAEPPEPVRVVAMSDEAAGQEREKVATALAAAEHIGLGKAATQLRRQRDSATRTTVRRVQQDAVTLNRLITTPLVAIEPAARGAHDGPANLLARSSASRRSPRPRLTSSFLGTQVRDRLTQVRDRVLPPRGRERSRERADDDDTGTWRRVRWRRRRVRDHRDRDRRNERVPSRPSRGTQRPAVLKFSVAVTAAGPGLLDGLTLHGESAAGQTVDFPLRRENGAGRAPALACELQVTLDPAGRRSQAWTLTLAAADGQELDTQVVTPPRDEDAALDLNWQVTTTPVVIELTSPVTPTLYGYALTLVPACPDPDPSLDWSGAMTDLTDQTPA